MQLRIYKISHPITKLISNNLLNKNVSGAHNELYYRYLGFLILYEMFRKNLKIKNLHIKTVKGINILNVIDNTFKYIILTNIIETYSIINEIKLVLPNITIIHVEYENFNNLNDRMRELNHNYRNANIFIIEKKTESDKITYIIDYLKKEKNVSLDNINIGNILSDSIALEKIGQKYPEIKIYTTQII